MVFQSPIGHASAIGQVIVGSGWCARGAPCLAFFGGWYLGRIYIANVAGDWTWAKTCGKMARFEFG